MTITDTDRGSARPRAGALVTAARVGWGLFFLGSAVYNAIVLVPQPVRALEWFASVSWPFAEVIVRDVALPVAMLLAVLVVNFELLTGVLILIPDWAELGLMMSLVWLLALVPFLGWYAIANLVAFAVVVPLTRWDHTVRSRVRVRQSSAWRRLRP